MPWKRPTHKPVRQRDVKRALARRVESRSRRGYTAEWDEASRLFLKLHPLCRMCQDVGRITPSRVTDHVVPHKGDMQLFWDRDNWQALCVRHHNRKTAGEDGGFGNKMQDLVMPQGIRRPMNPLIVVCGPPASGKTTYVEQHAMDHHLVIDVDRIAADRSLPERRERHHIEILLTIRNDMLRAYCRNETEFETCWLIATAGQPSHRRFWSEYGDVIVLGTSIDECIRRIEQRDISDEHRAKLIGVAMRWS